MPFLNSLSSIRCFSHPRILLILLLGAISGLPLALVASTLLTWLTELGVSLHVIGLFSAVTLPYTLKFLWSPLLDHLPPPISRRYVDHRRGWMIVLQCLLVASIVGLGYVDPLAMPWVTAALGFAISIFSASQDIVIDAYRIEILSEEEQGPGASMFIFGYRVGLLISGAGALFLADQISWQLVYIIMGGVILLGSITLLFAPSPEVEGQKEKADKTDWKQWIYDSVISPFTQFMKKEHWVMLLSFILLFKLGDAMAGVLTNTFLLQINFTKTEIAAVVKSYGFVATIIGTFVGGFMVTRFGMLSSLWVTGILQMLSNAVFAVQAQLGHDLLFLGVAISVENITSGMGAAVFVAFLSGLCTDRSYTATHYALLSSLASVGRTLIPAVSGYVVEATGWFYFFLITMVAALPGLVMLACLSTVIRQTLSHKSE